MALGRGRAHRPQPLSNSQLSSVPKEIDRGQVQRLVERGAQLVEALPAEEYEEDHDSAIAEAVLVSPALEPSDEIRTHGGNRKYAWIDSRLIQGVHAETITFSSYQDACEIALTPGWPWLGGAGLQGTREVDLGRTRPRRFRVRVSEAQARGNTTVCSIELLELDRLFTLRIRVALTLEPNNSGTRLTVSGLVVRDLVDDAESSRHLANEYVRSLIQQVAEEIERLKPRSEATARPGAPTRRK